MSAKGVLRNCRQWLVKARGTVGATCQGLVCEQNMRPLAEQLEPRLLLSGTTYVVNTLNDVVANDGHLSFREAILASNTNAAVNEAAAGSGTEKDTITFSSSLFSGGAATLNLTAGSVQINDALAIQGTSSNKPTITGSGQVEILSGKSVDLSYLTLQENTVNHGTLTLTNGVFDHALTLDGGSLSLVNSTITGGSITSSGSGGSVTAAGSTLNNATLNANLTVNNGSALTVTNGLTLNSVLSVGDGGASSNGTINFNGTQSLAGTGQVVLASTSFYVNGTSNNIATLTVASGITIHSTGLYGASIDGSYGTLVNNGSIIADSSVSENFSESGFYITTNSLVNNGTISASNGNGLYISNLKNDAGHSVSITGGGELYLTTVQNNGILSATNSTVYFDGSFKLADIGTFNRNGGTVNLTGTLDNTGATLLVDSAFSGGLSLAGGTIKGGTLQSNNPAYIMSAYGGTLDNVVLNTNLTIDDYSTLTVVNGLILNGTLTLGSSNEYFGGLNFNGTQTLTGTGKVVFAGYSSSLVVDGGWDTPAILTVGSGITMHAVGSYGRIGGYNASLVNQGSIIADTSGGNFSINLKSLVNDGAIAVSNGATVSLGSSMTIDGLNRVSSQSSGTIEVSGDLLGNTQNPSLYTPLGTTSLNGTGTAANPQLLEVMSQDLGTDSNGYKQNFAYGTLALGSNAYVKLVDQADNASGTGAEALYTNALIVPAGSTINLNGRNLYTRVAQINGTVVGGTITQILDSGALVLITPTPGTLSVAGELDEWSFYGHSGRALSIAVNTGSSGLSPALSPILGYAQVNLVDSSGNIVATASSTGSGQIVTLDNITLPSDGNYRIQIRAPQEHADSTGNYTINAWDVTVDISALILNQQKTGSIESPFGVDKWVFSATAGQQVSFKLLNSSTPGLVFELAGPGSWQGFTGITGNSDLITLPASGTYTLTAHSNNGQYGGAYTFKMAQTSQTELISGVAYNGTFAGSGQAQLFKVNLSKSSPLLIQLADSSSSDHTEVYVKFGSAPTRADYDYCATDNSSANQQLLLPMASTGTCYILVYGSTIPAASSYTLTATAADVFLNNVTPDQAGTGTDSVLTLTGAGFVAGTTVELVSSSGTRYAAISLKINSFSRMTATFGAGAVPAGNYSVEVTSAGGDTAQLADAFTMVQGGQAHLETQLIIPGSLGRHATATLYVEYTNIGDIAMDAPLLVLGSGDADGSDVPVMTLNQSLLTQGFWTTGMPVGFSDSIMILASGATPGLLQPGETVRVPVYYAGLLQNANHWWDFTDNQVEFSLGVLTADNTTTTIDWATLETSMQPASMTDAEWNPIWTNFITQTGTTWGDYVSMLDENAAYLGSLGESVNDISQLLAFEFAQADGLGPMRTLTSAVDASVEAPGIAITFSRFFAGSISLRNDIGTLGYGWSNNWDYSLATSSDGTVTITGPGGSTRSFQPDSRTAGKYFTSLGDYGTLTTRTGGGYTLRESDGSLYAFKADGSLDSIEDTNNNKITCSYTGGLLTSLTHSSGQYLHLSYTGGLLTGLVDQDGRATSYSYDSNQRLVSVTDDTGAVTGYTYNGHDLASVVYPGGTHRYFTYDSQGRVASASLDQDINKVSFSYDSAGTVFLTDALGNTTELYYDYRGLLVKATDPLGNIVSLSFDGFNNLSSITDAAGHSSYYSYDKKGNLIRSTDAAGHTTSMTYAGFYNRLSSLTDANGNTTLYGYDAKGNLTSITYANGASEHWSYNSLGSPTEWVNCRGSEVGYTYDSDGRITSKLYADGSQVTFTYDAHGNLLTATNSDGTTSFSYNTKDELTRVDYPGGQYLIFTYDAGGRRTSSIDQLGHSTNYQYDAAGRLSRVADEHGTVLAAYSYDGAGRLSRKNLGNGVYTTYGYDGAGQLLHLINHNADDSVMSRFDYTYDSRGRRTSMTTVDGAWTYEYDDIGQLTHAVFASSDPATIPDQDMRYVYDAMGNRIQTIENGVVTDYTVNSLNQYTKVGDTTYVFDLDGNLIQEVSASGTTTYTYNTENQLTGISSPQGTWSYGYDALGNRVETTANGVTATAVIDPAGLGNLVGSYDATGHLLSSYTYGYGLLTALSGANLTYYTFEALGSTSEVTNTAGQAVDRYVYAPFGSLLRQSETVANVFEFVGELGVMDDQNGLIYMRAREYDAGLGRFTQEDPIGVSGGLNLYAYTGNTVVSIIDPSGLEAGAWTSCKDRKPTITNPEKYQRLMGVYQDHEEIHARQCRDGKWPENLKESQDNEAEAYDNTRKQPSLTPYERDFYNDIYNKCKNHEPSCPANGPSSTGLWDKISQLFISSNVMMNVIVNVADSKINVANSTDPNALTGPSGYGTDHYLTTNSPFTYRIDFENDKTATAPAQQVTITNQLNANLELSTFQLTEIAFGDTIISVPTGSSHFETTVSLTYNKTFDVLIEAGINYATGLVTATFQSLDPDTELPPDVLTGFLPPEDGTGRGMGHVSYLIKAKPGLATGTQIRNIALISFDGQTLIATNQVDPHDPSKGTDPTKEARNTIDATTPTSSVTALPASSAASFQVSWSGSDAGSGIATYNVYVSTDGGDYTLWKEGLTDTSATYAGQKGHTYAFYSIARDHVGLAEQKTPVAEGSIRVKESTSRMLVSYLLANPLKTGANLMRQVPSLLKSLGYQPAEPLVASLALASEASASAAVSPMTFTTDNSLNLLQSATINADSEVDQQDTAAVQTLAQGTLQRLISTSQKPTGTVVGITGARNSDLIESNLLASEQPESSLSLTGMDTAAYLENSIQAESIPVIGNTWNSQTNQGAESSAWLFLSEESAAVHEGWDTAALNLVQHQSSPIVEPLAVSQELLDEWSAPLVRQAA